jgi:signal-transduction protein with cAMP-binding, CBS, and nucleotidyltransferase domain
MRAIEKMFVPSVEAVMSSPAVTVRPTASVMEAIELMAERHIGSIVVMANSTPVGIFTDHDLMDRVLKRGSSPLETKVSSVMSTPLITMDTGVSILKAVKRMREENISHLVILRRGVLAGVLTMTDIRLRFSRGYLSPNLLVKKFLVDTVAYITFWSGVTFVIQVLIVGLTWGQFVASSTIGFLATLILGGPFGRYLDVFRQKFEV